MDLKDSVALVTDGNDGLEQRFVRLDILVNDGVRQIGAADKDNCR